EDTQMPATPQQPLARRLRRCRLTERGTMKTHDPGDIVTIGGGMTASIIAARVLPETSLRMVSIEQGPAQWTYPDFAHNHDSLRFSSRYALMQDLNRSTWTWRPRAGAPALP